MNAEQIASLVCGDWTGIKAPELAEILREILKAGNSPDDVAGLCDRISDGPTAWILSSRLTGTIDLGECDDASEAATEILLSRETRPETTVKGVIWPAGLNREHGEEIEAETDPADESEAA